MAGLSPQLSPQWERLMREAAGRRVWMTTTTGLRSADSRQVKLGSDETCLLLQRVR